MKKMIEKINELENIHEPISPRCPKCGSSRTITKYHDGWNFTYPFGRYTKNNCVKSGEHFDSRCNFCGYIWSSDIDIFKKESE